MVAQDKDRGAQRSLAPGYRILAAHWRDWRALYRLEKAVFPTDAWPLLDLIAVLTWPGIVRLKAVVQGEMVGFVAAQVRSGVAWIATLGVLPAYRGQGIGRALMQACEARLPADKPIRLTVRRANLAAQRLYQSLGYRVIGLWPRYYVDREDALIMEKSPRLRRL